MGDPLKVGPIKLSNVMESKVKEAVTKMFEARKLLKEVGLLALATDLKVVEDQAFDAQCYGVIEAEGTLEPYTQVNSQNTLAFNGKGVPQFDQTAPDDRLVDDDTDR